MRAQALQGITGRGQKSRNSLPGISSLQKKTEKQLRSVSSPPACLFDIEQVGDDKGSIIQDIRCTCKRLRAQSFDLALSVLLQVGLLGRFCFCTLAAAT